MALSTISGGSLTTVDSVNKPITVKITRLLILSSLISLLAFILIIISFAAPYWLSSYKYTYSTFVRLGLWDFCFKDFHHPYYQFVDKFTGCYWIYSSKYHNIRDWLQPGWFIFVQTMLVFALLFSLFTLIALSVVLMLYFIRYQFIGIGIASFFQFATAFVLTVGLIVFRVMCYDRSWLENPNHNHLDWAYFVAVIALIVHCIAGVLLFKESIKSHQRRRKMNNLVYNMQPRSPREFGHSVNETTPMMLVDQAEKQQQQKQQQQQQQHQQLNRNKYKDEPDDSQERQWRQFTQV